MKTLFDCDYSINQQGNEKFQQFQKPSASLIQKAVQNIFPHLKSNQLDNYLKNSKDLNQFIANVVGTIQIPKNDYELQNALHNMRNIADEQEKTIQKNMAIISNKNFENHDEMIAQNDKSYDFPQVLSVLKENTTPPSSQQIHPNQQQQQQQILQNSSKFQQNIIPFKDEKQQKEEFDTTTMMSDDINNHNNAVEAYLNIENKKEFFIEEKLIDGYGPTHYQNQYIQNDQFEEEFQFKQFFKNEFFGEEHNFLNNSIEDHNLSGFFI